MARMTNRRMYRLFRKEKCGTTAKNYRDVHWENGDNVLTVEGKQAIKVANFLIRKEVSPDVFQVTLEGRNVLKLPEMVFREIMKGNITKEIQLGRTEKKHNRESLERLYLGTPERERSKKEKKIMNHITLTEAKALKAGDMIHSLEKKNADGTPMRAKVTSVQTWKTRPNEVCIRYKHGLRDFGSIRETELERFGLGNGS